MVSRLPYIGDFNQCCYDIGILDSRSTGAFLNWTKLDRAMISNKWAQEGWMVMANFGFPGKFSDHSPCVVSLFEDNDQRVRPFKFFNMFADHVDFMALVDKGWSMNIEGTAMFKPCRKIKALKGPLKALNRLYFSHISSRASHSSAALP